MNSSSTYDKNYELFVSLLAEMVVSYFAKSSNDNEQEGNKDVKQKSKGENLNVR
jgi:hypothetical protein